VEPENVQGIREFAKLLDWTLLVYYVLYKMNLTANNFCIVKTLCKDIFVFGKINQVQSQSLH